MGREPSAIETFSRNPHTNCQQLLSVKGIRGVCNPRKKSGADVRAANATGQIGDEQFNALVAEKQQPMTSAQRTWRAAAVALAAAPLAAVLPLLKSASSSSVRVERPTRFLARYFSASLSLEGTSFRLVAKTHPLAIGETHNKHAFDRTFRELQK